MYIFIYAWLFNAFQFDQLFRIESKYILIYLFIYFLNIYIYIYIYVFYTLRPLDGDTSEGVGRGAPWVGRLGWVASGRPWAQYIYRTIHILIAL